MSGGRNHDVKKLHSQYFTSHDDAIRVLDCIEHQWGPMDRPRVLEPAVGAGAFIRAARECYPDWEWVTNELFPENNNFEPDYVEDFAQLSPATVGPIDLVVTNPPWSGTVKTSTGRVDLGSFFINRCLEFADKAALILPAIYLRPRFLQKLEFAKVVGWTDPAVSSFAAGREEKRVKTSIMLFERTSKNEPKLLTSDVEGFAFAANYDEATHAICLWGNAGETRAINGMWGRLEPWTCETPVIITSPQIEHWLADNGLIEAVQEMASLNTNGLSEAEVIHYINEGFNAH